MKKIYSLLSALFFFISTQAQNPGDVIITEFMVDPSMVTDANGEWFEIYNTTAFPIFMDGWILKDSGTNSHVITSAGSIVIQPLSFFILAINGDTTMNGGVNADYVYSGFQMANSGGDEIILLRADSVLMDQITYTTNTTGKSRSLDPAHFSAADNDNTGNWCNATIQYGLGDYGTPKANNLTCLVGISELSGANALQVWYQENNLHVKMNGSMNSLKWKVADITGKTISTGALPKSSNVFSILLSELPSGVYMFSLPEKGLVKRFMVAGK
jgi:hypothetical protein